MSEAAPVYRPGAFYFSLLDGETAALIVKKARVLVADAAKAAGATKDEAWAAARQWTPDWSRSAEFWPDARGEKHFVTLDEWEAGIAAMAAARPPGAPK